MKINNLYKLFPIFVWLFFMVDINYLKLKLFNFYWKVVWYIWQYFIIVYYILIFFIALILIIKNIYLNIPRFYPKSIHIENIPLPKNFSWGFFSFIDIGDFFTKITKNIFSVFTNISDWFTGFLKKPALKSVYFEFMDKNAQVNVVINKNDNIQIIFIKNNSEVDFREYYSFFREVLCGFLKEKDCSSFRIEMFEKLYSHLDFIFEKEVYEIVYDKNHSTRYFYTINNCLYCIEKNLLETNLKINLNNQNIIYEENLAKTIAEFTKVNNLYLELNSVLNEFKRNYLSKNIIEFNHDKFLKIKYDLDQIDLSYSFFLQKTCAEFMVLCDEISNNSKQNFFLRIGGDFLNWKNLEEIYQNIYIEIKNKSPINLDQLNNKEDIVVNKNEVFQLNNKEDIVVNKNEVFQLNNKEDVVVNKNEAFQLNNKEDVVLEATNALNELEKVINRIKNL